MLRLYQSKGIAHQKSCSDSRNKTVLSNESIDIYWRLLVLYFFNPKLPSNFGVNMCFVRALLLITCLCLASILFLVTRNYTVMLLLLLIFAILVVFAIFLHLSKVVRNFSLADPCVFWIPVCSKSLQSV